MADKRKPIYFWLRLDNNFYKNLAIKKARKMAGGDTMVVIYQKMMLNSLDTSGVIYYEGVYGKLEEELALMIDEEPEQVAMTLAYFTKAGLIQIDNGQNVEMLQVPALIDQETNWARYKRNQRKTEKLDNVQSLSNERPTEIETEIDKEIELETDTKQRSYSQIVAMFENNGFGSVGGILSQNISDELKDFAAESNYSEATKVISKAIEIAVNQGNNRPAYVWGITKNWYQRKLFTLASIEAVENKRKKDTAASEARKQSDAEKQQAVKEKELLAHRQEQYEKVLSIYNEKFGFVRTPVFLQDTPDLKNNDVWELLVAGDDETYERLKQVVDSHE
ncbi:phage replisome organizer N-terminal domain-containing protein [Leuconostoc falkenbergense]|uniref:phage replisome organizer N-terminal domain-containing protein n=1 Tax=Leuconostoc falkenbergense TaxID=2766470 RepID=UPI002A812FA1|nr:phage replisome organizer N-terminal domain-containing protein [Leuconostoc falkenbergense]MDY5163301.1 phage replisome organizer N-terminal domain-containing protein [Leuconostoc falkenbergense]